MPQTTPSTPTHPALDALWRAQQAQIAAGFALRRQAIEATRLMFVACFHGDHDYCAGAYGAHICGCTCHDARRAGYVARASECAGLLAGIGETSW